MRLPFGFRQRALVTSLGTMAYQVGDAAPWQDADQLDASTGEKGRSPLIFLHGFGGGSSCYEWSLVYPAFASEYQVIAPDLLGWGASDHPERNYTVEDYLTSIKEFLDQVSSEPLTVVASSLTAALLVRLAIAEPDRFATLILTAPAALSDFGDDYQRSPIAQIASTPILDRLFYRGALATEGGIRNFLEQRQFAKADRVTQEMVNAYLASAQHPNAEYSALSFVRGDLCFDLAQYIGQLTVPTAILWGGSASFTPSSLAQRFAELNPGAIQICQVIPDVGLTPQLEVPAVTIGLIRQCLATLANQTSRPAVVNEPDPDKSPPK